MKPVEQATFTSVEDGPQCGYQMSAAAPGPATPIWASRPLGNWCTSDQRPVRTPRSFNFHPLPSGAYCLSRTTLADGDHDGGPRVYTHCLIVPPQVLDRFANHAFRAVAGGLGPLLVASGRRAAPGCGPFGLPRQSGGLGSGRCSNGGRRTWEQRKWPARPSGARRPLPGRGRCGSADGLDGRAPELPAGRVPAGVFFLHRAEVLAATALPHGDALR